MKRQAVLFDFDGVAVKSMEQHFEAWQKAFAEQGVQISGADFYVLEGQGIRVISRQLGEHYGLNETQIEEVMDRKVNFYNQFMKLEFYDYFFDLLRNLKAQEIPMGIVTGGLRSRVQGIISTHFNGFFNCLVTVDDVERGKPFPDPFLRAAELLNVAPQKCIVVENAPLGIEGAVAAGMTVIAVTTTLPPDLLKQAHYVVHDFREAERIIESLFLTGIF